MLLYGPQGRRCQYSTIGNKVTPILYSGYYRPQVCVCTTFHVVISEKESVELFYKVRNGWNRSGLALGCSLAKLF